jgi:hypothetical protein
MKEKKKLNLPWLNLFRQQRKVEMSPAKLFAKEKSFPPNSEVK